jgi:hypothetical protein
MLNISEQEKRRILTLHMLAEQKYAESSVNIGGKLIPSSKATMEIINATISRNQYKKALDAVLLIKNSGDLNLVIDELKNILNTTLETRINRAIFNVNKINKMNFLNDVKAHFKNFADVSFDERGENLKITSKTPNAKADTRSAEQKRDDDIANKEKMRQYVNSMYCTVKNGVIVNPASQWNNRPWSEFVSTVKVTAEQLASAKAACPNGELSKSQQPAQTQWTKETFPLRFMMKGPNVGKLQQALGIKPTNQFYTKTEAKVNSKMKELGLTYNRATGIDQTTFNKIISTKGSTPQDIAGQTVKNWAQNLQKTDNLPTPEEFEKQQQPTTQKTQLTPQELAKAQAIAKQYGNEPLKGI